MCRSFRKLPSDTAPLRPESMLMGRRFSDDGDETSDIPVEVGPDLPKPRFPKDTGQNPVAIVLAMLFVFIERKVVLGLPQLNPPGVETTGNLAADSKP